MNSRSTRFVVALPCIMAAIAALYVGLAEQPRAFAQTRTLTFADRVEYQRAIEEVYWRHRIWPKERPDSKPSLDQVIPRAELEKKVADYLRNSKALEDYWQRPLSAEQLQAEMERMAQYTKQPEVLRELFAALGNDPFVIAECLARPALSERLVTNWYAYDQRFHGELRRRAEAELQAHPTIEQMRQTNGTYSEIELIRSDNAEEEGKGAAFGVKLNSGEWNESVQKLAAMFGDAKVDRTQSSDPPIKTGVFSSLQEDEERYYATTVISKTPDRLKLALITWRKESFESWRNRAQNQVTTSIALATANYTLPTISNEASGCTDDTWTSTPAPPDRRTGHTAVWTGTEMIVWGGDDYPVGIFNTGGRFNPSTSTWTPTSTTNAPIGRHHHTAVWTGSEMIVWGGIDTFDGSGYGVSFNSGGRYNPGTDSWIPTSTVNAPSGRSEHTAVWTGSEMIVWGGADSGVVNSGGRYNPNTDVWSGTSTINAPAARYLHTAVWTGTEMIAWGGADTSGFRLNTGGRYNPATNSWTATAITSAPVGRYDHTTVWTGTEMIVWGGVDGSVNYYSNTGGRYNLNTNTWMATSTTNAPVGRASHTAVWSGSQMIVWGGYGNGGNFNSGGKYNPNTNSWIATGTANAPSVRYDQTAVWTGSEMIIWGGVSGSYEKNDGGRYNPSTDNWTAVGSTPTNRSQHAAVWTGSEMIVWGGFVQDSGEFLNTGGKYNPSTDSWTTTTTTNAPARRYIPSGVWTGIEMIVWGGHFLDTTDHYLNTGGRYNPNTDSWAVTSTINAPTGRGFHTAVWSGSEMIVWGGYFYDGSDHYLNTGGRYNPNTDSWTATNTINAPTGRDAHKAVWTGSGMIIWGGLSGTTHLNTGGKYDPNSNSWAATSTTNVPTGRTTHAMVWIGSEMIVWGGYDGSSYLNTGARYNPSTNTWTATSTTNAPSARLAYGPAWTGNEMIVWGGYDGVNYLGDGGKYNPGTDSWTGTSSINAPDARYRHSGVWTGRQMIVWAGILSSNIYTNTGGLYCAQSGSPTPTPTPTVTPTATPTPAPKQNQTITFPAISTKIYGAADFDPGATASSGLPVSYGATGQCTIVSNKVHISAAGLCTVTANQSGNSQYNAAQPVSRSFSILKAGTTTTSSLLPNSPNPTPQFSDTSKLSATVKANATTTGNGVFAGTVSFTFNGAVIGSPISVTNTSPTAQLSIRLDQTRIPAGAGSYNINATFTPSATSNYGGSTSGAHAVVIKHEGEKADSSGDGSTRLDYTGKQYVLVGSAPTLSVLVRQSLAPEGEHEFVDYSKMNVYVLFRIVPAGCGTSCSDAAVWQSANIKIANRSDWSTTGLGTAQVIGPTTLAQGSYLVLAYLVSNGYVIAERAAATLDVGSNTGRFITGGGFVTTDSTSNAGTRRGYFGFNVRGTTTLAGNSAYLYRIRMNVNTSTASSIVSCTTLGSGCTDVDIIVRSNSLSALNTGTTLTYPLTGYAIGHVAVQFVNAYSGVHYTAFEFANGLFRLDVLDNSSGGSTDKYGFTAYRGNLSIFHQAYVGGIAQTGTGAKTNQITIGGGNTTVHPK